MARECVKTTGSCPRQCSGSPVSGAVYPFSNDSTICCEHALKKFPLALEKNDTCSVAMDCGATTRYLRLYLAAGPDATWHKISALAGSSIILAHMDTYCAGQCAANGKATNRLCERSPDLFHAVSKYTCPNCTGDAASWNDSQLSAGATSQRKSRIEYRLPSQTSQLYATVGGRQKHHFVCGQSEHVCCDQL